MFRLFMAVFLLSLSIFLISMIRTLNAADEPGDYLEISRDRNNLKLNIIKISNELGRAVIPERLYRESRGGVKWILTFVGMTFLSQLNDIGYELNYSSAASSS